MLDPYIQDSNMAFVQESFMTSLLVPDRPARRAQNVVIL